MDCLLIGFSLPGLGQNIFYHAFSGMQSHVFFHSVEVKVINKQLSGELGMRLPLGMCRVGAHHQSAADGDGWL